MYTRECIIERQRLKEIKDKGKQRERKKNMSTKKEGGKRYIDTQRKET